ncbi:twin-arginine translocation signal domain-containing protein [Campylobacter vulpis]|uniref:Tat pathway signal protein n=1 Tax=Campylobacter vulpis TaxID=1655500 RepID=A0A2G4QZU7_9BACT|nr:twin-arginine translocation signal domain-containing protein [Campylobacter vulpis]MBS4235966.1 twin-arginine translocation signal domain-containing protein [Campylobacter vulpis]MBS4241035.1 twin-arginine translocation signal domain-containing protein [Campylobacter vulpis]MBS4252457.1 twin-arginine translocation signal domain-containing protein [Campylobacter vulpis]MBS4269367.1 twin-arginine translocation signal domain-containing protein [Campylobacter vulpis]MBS4275524.1 twin-arginine t
MEKRRKFLKNSALALAGVGVLGATSVAFGEEKAENKLVRGKSKKKEVLYQRSANWEKYYIKAE